MKYGKPYLSKKWLVLHLVKEVTLFWKLWWWSQVVMVEMTTLVLKNFSG